MFSRKRVLQIQIKTDWEDYSKAKMGDAPEKEVKELKEKVDKKRAELEEIERKEEEEHDKLKREQEQSRREMVTGKVIIS